MKLVRLLIEDGANAGLKDRQGRTAQNIAETQGYDAMAGYLAKAQPELHAAAVVGNVARIRELLAADVPVDGEDVNGRTPLMLAAEKRTFAGDAAADHERRQRTRERHAAPDSVDACRRSRTASRRRIAL